MRKVGLCIQFEGVDNYGTVLQAMATKAAIESMGYQVKIIRYKKKYDLKYIIQQVPRLFDSTRWKIIKRRYKRKHDLKNHKDFYNHRIAAKSAFADYRKQYFPNSDIVSYYGYDSLCDGSKQFDAVLVGSDQLWLPVGVGSNFYNLNFVAPGVKRISYATSFGVSTIPQKQKKDFTAFLCKINCLSVREESGVQIVKELAKIDAFLACDPVMLLSSIEWSNICKNNLLPNGVHEEYLLCYFLGGNEAARTAARNVAEQLNLQLVAISYMEDYFSCDDRFGDIAPLGVRPEQFVKLIQHAKYVMTDSFHGTAFSIIFERPFLTTYRFNNSSKLSKNSRIDNVLKKFGLEDRLFIGGNPVEKMLKNIKYDEVSELREKWSLESKFFLRQALEENDVTQS